MIDWKDGAVCFGNSRQWPAECMNLFSAIGGVGTFGDFQLNEIREGDYIEASELDNEQMYNDAVSVFKLFGFEDALSYRANVDGYAYSALFVGGSGDIDSVSCRPEKSRYCKRKITYPQLMAIGKLKRDTLERKTPPFYATGFNTVEQSRDKRARRNKSKQAYDILKSLDYEYDLNKQKWYKKEWV